jgi:streptogramin lyase
MKSTVRATVSAGSLALAAVGVVAVVIVGARLRGPAVGASPASSPAPSITASQSRSVDLGDSSYALAYDAKRDSLWLSTFSMAGPDYLVRVDPVSMSVERFPLPDVQYNGFVSQLKLASDEAIWVTEPYAIVRFDPTTRKSDIFSLTEDVVDALPGALDAGNPLPGTWVSAIAPYGDGALVARNNVATLSMLSATGTTEKRIAVPLDYAGAQDIAVTADGSIYVTTGPTKTGNVAELDPTGNVRVEFDTPATRIWTVGDHVLASGTSTGAADLSASGVTAIGSGISSNDSVLGYGSGAVVIYDHAKGTFLRYLDGALTWQLTFPEAKGQLSGPNGNIVDVHSFPRVNAISVDGHGVLWYLDGNSNKLVALDQ